MTDPVEFGPGHPEWCPVGDPDEVSNHGHCAHWYECEPCHRCGDDTPDPSCDCPRCTYDRQAENGYPNGRLRKNADPDAPWPSGMCGKKAKCEACPSDFLCFMKAKAEHEAVEGRTAGVTR